MREVARKKLVVGEGSPSLPEDEVPYSTVIQIFFRECQMKILLPLVFLISAATCDVDKPTDLPTTCLRGVLYYRTGYTLAPVIEKNSLIPFVSCKNAG
jgi:hypothetical protein